MATDDPIAMFSALFERAAREQRRARRHGAVDGRRRRPSVRAIRAAQGRRRARVRVLHQPRKPQGAGDGGAPVRGVDVLLAAGDAGADRGRRRARVGRRRRRVLRDAAARLADRRMGLDSRAPSWHRARRSTSASREVEDRFANGADHAPAVLERLQGRRRGRSSSGRAIPRGCTNACIFQRSSGEWTRSLLFP